MKQDHTYIDRCAAGVDAAYEALDAQFQSRIGKAPKLYDVPAGKPLIRVDGVIDLELIVAAVLKASDAVKDLSLATATVMKQLDKNLFRAGSRVPVPLAR